MTSREAAELLQALIAASRACLDKLGIPRTPGGGRTRSWRSPGGPEGIAYHYTGGLSGLKSLRWFNDPSWGNTESSAHVLIFDRVTPELELWSSQEVASVFKVPALIIADVTRGVWATNWANSRCLGVENRNAGALKYDERTVKKARVFSGGWWWEPYTREQMEANVLIGRMFRALRGDGTFKPEWIVGHSQIWATKHDPGPLFPLHLVRRAIWSEEDLARLDWISMLPSPLEHGSTAEDELTWTDYQTGFRGDPPKSESSWDATTRPGSPPPAESHDLTLWLCDTLHRMGWPTWPEVPSDDQLRCFVSYYQRSTLAWKKDQPGKVLSVDGVAGDLTRKSMNVRLQELGTI